MNDSAAKKNDQTRTMEIGTSVVFGIILAVFTIGFIPLSHPVLTRKVAEFVRQAGIDSCTIGSVRIALWKGMTLRDVRSCGAIDSSGRRCTVEARTIILSGNFIRTVINYKKIDRRLFCVAAFRRNPASAFGSLCRSAAVLTRGIAVSGAEFTVTATNRPLVSGQDCSASITFTENGRGDFTGPFSAPAIMVANVPALRRLSGDIAGSAESLRLMQCTGEFFSGKFKVDARVIPVRNTIAGLTFSLSGFNIDEWYKYADTSSGRLSGKADCGLVLDSSSLIVDSLRGRGSVSMVHFEVSKFPFQQTLAGLLAYPGLSHLRFRKAKADFTIKPAGVITTEVTGSGDSLSITASGWINTRGQVNEKAEFAVSKIAVHTLPKFAQETLEETSEGGRILRLRIFGDVYTPKFEIDSRIILQKAVKNMFEDVRDNLQKWLK
jgi:hypothetical protein